jgi:hypothetical protein
MADMIRDNTDQPRLSRGDSLRAIAAEPGLDPRLAQMLRDHAVQADSLDAEIEHALDTIERLQRILQSVVKTRR